MLPKELFAEPGWDLLLELFVADSNGHRLTARDVSDRANIPPTVLSRWLIHLTEIGFIVTDGGNQFSQKLGFGFWHTATKQHIALHVEGFDLASTMSQDFI